MTSLIVLAALLQVSPADRSSAQDCLRRGTEAYRAHDYATAVSEFSRGYALYPTPTFLLNLGLAHDSAGHDKQAIQGYERFLAEVEQPKVEVDPTWQARLGPVRKRLQELRSVRGGAWSARNPGDKGDRDSRARPELLPRVVDGQVTKSAREPKEGSWSAGHWLMMGAGLTATAVVIAVIATRRSHDLGGGCPSGVDVCF